MKAKPVRLTPGLLRAALLLVTVALLFRLPMSVHACACCAEEGEWDEGKMKIEESLLTEINRLKPSAKASLVTTAAFPEGVNGIAGITDATDTSFNVALSRSGRQWTLALTDAKGGRGALVFSVPPTATFLNADIHDGLKGGGGGPLLYKELRLEGKAWGNGIFAKGITADTKFRLVLQGRGNHCPAAEDFKGWNLRVSGAKADYTFYGSFAPPAKP